MMKLIKNEYKKFSKSKLLVSMLFIVSIVYLIIYLNRNSSVNDLKNTVFSLIPFIGVLVSVIFGGIVSNEFQNGTIRIYLTKPYKRSKILLSKLLFMYLVIVCYLLIIFLSYFIIINIFKSYSFDVSYLKEIIVHFIPIFFISTLTLFLSVVTNNTASTVGISIVICLVSNIIAQVFFGFGYNFLEYTFLPYIDFSIFKDTEYLILMKEELNVVLTIKNGIIILVINMLMLVFLSLNIFVKKDIKN